MVKTVLYKRTIEFCKELRRSEPIAMDLVEEGGCVDRRQDS